MTPCFHRAGLLLPFLRRLGNDKMAISRNWVTPIAAGAFLLSAASDTQSRGELAGPDMGQRMRLLKKVLEGRG